MDVEYPGRRYSAVVATILRRVRGGVTTAALAATRILALGFEPPALFGAAPNVTRFSLDLKPRGLEHMADVLAEARSEDVSVLVIHPEWAAEPALGAIDTVTAALALPRLAHHATSLPPLAGGILASLAGSIEPTVPGAGVLAAALGRVEQELSAAAWLGSLTGLEYPAPSMLQHAASTVPGASFGVVSHPSPSITRLTRRRRKIPLVRPSHPFAVAIGGRSSNPEWVRDIVVPMLGSPPVIELSPSSLGPRWWGTTKLTEFVAYPTDVPALAARVMRGLKLTECGWCGERIAVGRCPFCRSDMQALEEVAG